MKTFYRVLRVLFVCAVVQVVIPWSVSLAVSAEASIGVLYILFFMLEPLFALIMGLYAGRQIRLRWFTALAVPVMFLLGIAAVFGAGVVEFLVYSVTYLLLTLAGMLASYLFTAWREARKKADAEKSFRTGGK